MTPAPDARGETGRQWRRDFKIKLTGVLLAKLLGLALLWFFFFSSAHRVTVTSFLLDERLSVARPMQSP